jgi:hypothetical protein
MADIPFSDFGGNQVPVGEIKLFSASTPINYLYEGQTFLRGGYFETNPANFNSVAWANSLGGQWHLRSSGTSETLFCSASNGATIIAAGANNAARFSVNSGQSWSTASAGFGASSNSIRCALFSRSLYLLGGEAGKLSTSTDGSTFTARTSGMPGVGFILGLADDGAGYVAVNENGNITRSTNGTTGWVEVQSAITTNANPAGVSFGNGFFVVPTDQPSRWYRSSNGTTWTAVTGLAAVSDTDNINQAKFVNSLHHVWNGTLVYTSSAGATGTWTTYDLSSILSAIIKSIDFISGKYLVACADGSAWTFATGFTNAFPAQTKFGGSSIKSSCVSSGSFVGVGVSGKVATSVLQAGVDAYTDPASFAVQYVRIK